MNERRVSERNASIVFVVGSWSNMPRIKRACMKRKEVERESKSARQRQRAYKSHPGIVY